MILTCAWRIIVIVAALVSQGKVKYTNSEWLNTVCLCFFRQYNDIEAVAICGTCHTSLVVDSRFYGVLVQNSIYSISIVTIIHTGVFEHSQAYVRPVYTQDIKTPERIGQSTWVSCMKRSIHPKKCHSYHQDKPLKLSVEAVTPRSSLSYPYLLSLSPLCSNQTILVPSPSGHYPLYQLKPSTHGLRLAIFGLHISSLFCPTT